MNTERWLARASDFGVAIKDYRGPVSFVLGAGCSLSSGAPSTARVHSVFEKATQGRADGRPVRDFLQHISESERQRMLARLFEGISPYLGYRALATLARSHRVHVFNLNWDPLVELACRQAGVECVSFDLQNEARWSELSLLPADQGLLCVHAHGLLGERCSYSHYETARFTESEENFVRDNFWAHPLLIAGASLQGDLDLARLLDESPTASQREHSVWFFGRQSHRESPEARANEQRQLFDSHAQPTQFTVATDVDFDRLMLAVLEAVKGQPWAEEASRNPSTWLPSASELVPVRSSLLRPYLDKPVLALVGEPRLGKTVLAWLLAHYFRLWAPGEVEVRRISSPQGAVSALGTLCVGDTDQIPQVYLIENPFGPTDKFEENPEFLNQLGRILREIGSPGFPAHRIIITSRFRAWFEALHKYGDASGSEVPTLPTRPAEWYEPKSLNSLAAGDDLLESLITQGVVRTPGVIASALKRKKALRNNPAAQPDLAPFPQAEDAVKDLSALLGSFSALGRVCGIVRLQAFCGQSFSEEDVLCWAAATGCKEQASAFLHRFRFEDGERLQLDHPCTLEATDLYLREHIEELAASLAAQLPSRHPVLRAVEVWRLLVGDTADGHVPALERWGAAYFAAQPSLARLRSVLDQVPDQWAMTELAYELARLWRTLPSGAERQALLQTIVNDRPRRGGYALYEACLYLQGAAPREIAATVDALSYGLNVDPDASREAALMVDGWMWRPLLDSRLPDWVLEHFENLKETDPGWALVRFLAAYHPDGFTHVPPVIRERDRHVRWTPEQAEFAAWLVEWHFVHQARSRVLLSQMRETDKNLLCRTLHPVTSDATETIALQRFVSSLAAHAPYSGWAFHAGCSVMCVRPARTEDLETIMRGAIRSVPPGDLGFITASLAYQSAEVFQSELCSYFNDASNRNKLLDVLAGGLQLEGTTVHPPDFVLAASAAKIHELLDLQWPRAKRQNIPTQEPSRIAQRLWGYAQPAIRGGRVTSRQIEREIEKIERGDLRWLEQHATSARAGHDPLQQVLDVYVSRLSVADLLVS